MRRNLGFCKGLKIVTLAAAAILSACATNPDKIDTSYVSRLKFNEYDCQQITVEMEHVSQRSTELYQRLKEEHEADQWQMGVGLVLFWPVLFALEGGDGPGASEYAHLKGEFEALRDVSVRKKCGLDYPSPEELIKQEQQDLEAKTKDNDDKPYLQYQHFVAVRI